jgi:hypothetical protein
MSKFSRLVLAAALSSIVISSYAAIDNGAGGNGELFFSAFDGVSSYSYDLNASIDAFETGKNTAGLYSFISGSDFTSSFSAWKSTANASTLEWNILATDTAGQRRIISTVGAAVLPATNKDAGVLRTAAANIQTTVNAINQLLVGNSAVANAGTAAYAGTMGLFYPKFNFDTTGTLANNNYANGLAFQITTANATGLTLGVNTAYVDETVAVRVWVGSDNTLHLMDCLSCDYSPIPQLPELESFAMLLAGLGVISAATRRRKQNL